MPLGRQFRDTYWHDADGDIRTSEDRGDKYPYTIAGHGDDITDGPPDTPQTNLQGMLFGPREATGLRGDTLAGDREQTIKDSLDLNSVDKYRRRLGNMIPGQRVETRRLDENGQPVMAERRSDEWNVTSKRGVKAAKQDMDLVAKTLDETDMPTHVIARTSAQPVLDPNEGRAYAEDHSGRVRLTTHLKKTHEWTGGEEVTQPKVTRGEPIINRQFHAQVNKIDWNSEEGAAEDMHAGGTTNRYYNPSRQTADVHFTHSTGEKADMTGRDFRRDDVQANVWPGTGKDTDKYVTQSFKVFNGGWGGRENHRTFHTRHQAVQTGEMETVTTPRKMVTTTERTTNPATLVHELGHVRDPATADPFSHRKALGHKADPIEEGIADGHADRFVRHAGQYNETLHPDAPGRTKEIEGRASGYGIDYHHWKGDKVGKALYVAGRAHAAISDNAATEIPTRASLASSLGIDTPRDARSKPEVIKLGEYGSKKYKYKDDGKAVVKQADTMLLGHMYGEHEHVRVALNNLGMGEVGQKAHAEYQSRLEAQKPKSQQFEQISFPGM